MGKKCSIILFTLLLSAGYLSAQSAQQADGLFAKQEYRQAKEAYRNLLHKAPQNALYLYRYARCAYKTGETEEAIRYFEEAGEKYALRNYYLGELYLSTYRFEQAIAAYQKYADSIGEDHERYAYVQAQMEKARKGARYLKRVEDIVITDSVILRKADFLQAYQLSKESGSISMDENGVCYTNERGDRKIVTSDENGEKDLISCQRLLEGAFSCDTLPAPVNTLHNEAYPFMLSDGITLYFASDSPDGMGGYDLYITQYNSNIEGYVSPENLGMPFNSPGNDYMLAIDETRHIGYFATDRHTGDSLVAVYTFIPNDEKRILREQTEEYIRLAAQLKVHRTDTTENILPATTPKTPQLLTEDTTEQAFTFVLNDSTLYRHFSDFCSADARALYGKYQLLEQQLNTCRAQTANYRKQYKISDENGQKELKERLLQLEKDYIDLLHQMPVLLRQIREMEHKVRHPQP